MSITDLSHLFSISYDGLKLGKEPTKFAKVLYTAVLGLHFEREQQKKDKQLAIF